MKQVAEALRLKPELILAKDDVSCIVSDPLLILCDYLLDVSVYPCAYLALYLYRNVMHNFFVL